MINLMPFSHKESLRYARRNTLLWHWLLGVIILLTLTASTIIVGTHYLRNETKRFAAVNTDVEQELQDNNIDETLKQVESISSNLKLIIEVLSKQVVFSELIAQIGSVMPRNAVLSDIEIGEVQGGIDLIAEATDYTTATQIQVNLEDPANKLFDKVDIVSIECDQTPGKEYPCRAIFRALFTESNPYLFVNLQKAEGSQQ